MVQNVDPLETILGAISRRISVALILTIWERDVKKRVLAPTCWVNHLYSSSLLSSISPSLCEPSLHWVIRVVYSSPSNNPGTWQPHKTCPQPFLPLLQLINCCYLSSFWYINRKLKHAPFWDAPFWAADGNRKRTLRVLGPYCLPDFFTTHL